MADFFNNLFFRGLPAEADNYVGLWFGNSLEMLLVCLALVYLVTVLLLSRTNLYRSERTQLLVDVDSRILLCLSWVLVFVFLVLTLIVVWLWYWGELVPEKDTWMRGKAVAAHWTVMAVLLVIWGALYWGRRHALKRLQAAIPNV